jgi:hypothetical protein
MLSILRRAKAQDALLLPGILYVFREQMHRDGSSQAAVQLGDRSFIERYIAESEFEAVFVGSVARSIDGVNYIGVWSVRIASRMRRILRERGAAFRVVNSPPQSRNVEINV